MINLHDMVMRHNITLHITFTTWNIISLKVDLLSIIYLFLSSCWLACLDCLAIPSPSSSCPARRWRTPSIDFWLLLRYLITSSSSWWSLTTPLLEVIIKTHVKSISILFSVFSWPFSQDSNLYTFLFPKFIFPLNNIFLCCSIYLICCIAFERFCLQK